MKREPTPIAIRRIASETDPANGIGLDIRWSDGGEMYLTSEKLRRACPCATCAEERGEMKHAAPLSPKSRFLRVVEATADESLKISVVWPIGNYAIGLRWGDGHDTGIYPYPLLLQLGHSTETLDSRKDNAGEENSTLAVKHPSVEDSTKKPTSVDNTRG